MPYDFTLRTYGELCQTVSIVQKDCRFLHHLEHRDDSRIILRHDVDRKPENALRMAKLEHELGLRSTYYFRCVPVSFDASIISQISEMGHEIGYHYEVMSKARGDVEKAKIIFQEDLGRLRSISEVRTACMHGSPGSKYDNKQFWKKYDMGEFSLTGEAYLSVEPPVDYFTDTGGKWNSRFNIRDKLNSCSMPYADATEDVISRIDNRTDSIIYISCHPERWASSRPEAIGYAWKDLIQNMIKRFLISTVNYQ